MRTRKTRRIGLTEADRLVAGKPPGPGHRGLGVLLDAATAPPSVEELAGETAAVARFVAAFRDPAAQPSTSNRVWVRRPARMVAVKVAAGVAVLAAGGTAVAAETGSLPAGVQQFFATLGAPAPNGGPQPTATGAGPAPPSGPASPSSRPVPSRSLGSGSPTPAPPRSPATTLPAETTALGLCRAWDAFRADPRSSPLPAASRRSLAAAAGGENEIADFCADLLATSTVTTGSKPSTGASNGDGNGDGDGDGKDNGQGQPAPTPSPRNSPQP